MIPRHLQPYIEEAIKSGLHEPFAILERAVERCNAVCLEMHDGQSRRSQIIRNAMMVDVWADATR